MTYWSTVKSVAFNTSAAPGDRYVGLTLAGNNDQFPNASTLADMAYALSVGSGMPLEQIFIDSENVV